MQHTRSSINGRFAHFSRSPSFAWSLLSAAWLAFRLFVFLSRSVVFQEHRIFYFLFWFSGRERDLPNYVTAVRSSSLHMRRMLRPSIFGIVISTTTLVSRIHISIAKQILCIQPESMMSEQKTRSDFGRYPWSCEDAARNHLSVAGPK